MASVGDEFPKAQERARELLKQYESLGTVGTFGAITIRAAIKEGDEALASGDVVRTLRAYDALIKLK